MLLYVLKAAQEFLGAEPYAFKGQNKGREPQGFHGRFKAQVFFQIVVIVDEQAYDLASSDVHTFTPCKSRAATIIQRLSIFLIVSRSFLKGFLFTAPFGKIQSDCNLSRAHLPVSCHFAGYPANMNQTVFIASNKVKKEGVLKVGSF